MDKEQEKNLYLELADTPIIRAAIQAIPHIGSPLDTLVFSRAQKIKEARLMALIAELKTNLSTISEEMIDKRYLESEEFLSLAERIFKEVINEADEKKRLYFKNALKSSSLVLFSEYDKDTIIKALQQISCAHVQILRSCSEVKNAKTFNIPTLEGMLSVRRQILMMILEYLVSVGLMYKEAEVSSASAETDNSIVGERRNVNVDVDLDNVYGVTELGKRLIQFIEA